MRVSVVIPAYRCQASLDVVLAALSRQTYPADLLEVIVVDDGSQPPLTLPPLRPEHCRIVRVVDGWGIGNAVHLGAQHATGDVLHRLDADMVTFPQHIEAQARWHHVADDVVTLGYKRFVRDDGVTPEEIVRHCDEGTIDRAFPDSEPHDYVERMIDRTDQLRRGDHLSFLAQVGATVAMRRDLYLASGGLSRELRLGEDTELGYRLAQAGAVFVPEPAARSWHLGPSSMMRQGRQLRRFNHPHLADLMPQPRWLRQGAGRIWAVPLVTAVVPAAGSFETVRACVDRLLASDADDLRVVLVGPWHTLTGERRSILADPLLDLRLLAATYRSEARVRLEAELPATVFPSPYRIDVPPHAGVHPSTVGRLVAVADAKQVGLLRAGPLTLWRTAAVSRALRTRQTGESLMDAVAAVYGQHTVTAKDIVDLSGLAPAALSTPPRRSPRWRAYTASGGRRAGDVVMVGGLRSLLKAAVLVASKSVGLR